MNDLEKNLRFCCAVSSTDLPIKLPANILFPDKYYDDWKNRDGYDDDDLPRSFKSCP